MLYVINKFIFGMSMILLSQVTLLSFAYLVFLISFDKTDTDLSKKFFFFRTIKSLKALKKRVGIVVKNYFYRLVEKEAINLKKSNITKAFNLFQICTVYLHFLYKIFFKTTLFFIKFAIKLMYRSITSSKNYVLLVVDRTNRCITKTFINMVILIIKRARIVSTFMKEVLKKLNL